MGESSAGTEREYQRATSALGRATLGAFKPTPLGSPWRRASSRRQEPNPTAGRPASPGSSWPTPKTAMDRRTRGGLGATRARPRSATDNAPPGARRRRIGGLDRKVFPGEWVIDKKEEALRVSEGWKGKGHAIRTVGSRLDPIGRQQSRGRQCGGRMSIPRNPGEANQGCGGLGHREGGGRSAIPCPCLPASNLPLSR